MRVIIGGLEFSFASLKVNELAFEPVRDQTGLTLEAVQVTLDIGGVCNRVWTATGKADPHPGTLGDEMPTTIANLRDYALRERQYFFCEINSRTVLEAPGVGPGGVRLPSDLRGGPFPQRFAFTPFFGEKTALFSYRIVAHVLYSNKLILSNAWSASATVDHRGYTTRRISGVARFNKGLLDQQLLQADDFRNVLVVPVGTGMRRVGATATAEADGMTLRYTAEDKEVTYGLGDANDVVEVTGGITAGVDAPIKNMKQAVGVVGEAGGVMMKALSFDLAGAAKDVLRLTWNTTVPTHRIVGIARATGRKDANRNRLFQSALNVLLDRASPSYDYTKKFDLIKTVLDGRGGLASLYCTFSCDSENAPYCEIKLECFGSKWWSIDSYFNYEPQKFIKTAPEFSAFPVASTDRLYSPGVTAPRLPASANTRGTWLERLVTQALLDADDYAETIPAVPAPQPAANARGMV